MVVKLRAIAIGDEYVTHASTPGWRRVTSEEIGILCEGPEFTAFISMEQIMAALEKLKIVKRKHAKRPGKEKAVRCSCKADGVCRGSKKQDL
jgi:hypothetical protein